ncbi:hypothetical protein AMECASPLE_036961 [Ameca splendens]|uniref:Uncharacterized protein n=1 Tax=Ameca splendens TaxID=208324 RepID=A0ABV0Z6N1_9TELE
MTEAWRRKVRGDQQRREPAGWSGGRRQGQKNSQSEVSGGLRRFLIRDGDLGLASGLDPGRKRRDLGLASGLDPGRNRRDLGPEDRSLGDLWSQRSSGGG